jgi:hypothetical protein
MTLTLYTSSWFTRLPPEIARIGISRGTPRGQSGFKNYRPLAPGEWFKRVDTRQYDLLYTAQLEKLDPQKVLEDLTYLSGACSSAALLCYESPHKPEDWCHRAWVSRWLHDKLGMKVFEYGLEQHGCGHQHPKLPRSMQVTPVTDRSAEIAHLIGSLISIRGKPFQVRGIDPTMRDHALLYDGKKEQSCPVEVVLKYAN